MVRCRNIIDDDRSYITTLTMKVAIIPFIAGHEFWYVIKKYVSEDHHARSSGNIAVPGYMWLRNAYVAVFRRQRCGYSTAW